MSLLDLQKKAILERIAANPLDADGPYSLGVVCYQAGQKEEALEAFSKAESLAPKESRTLYALGLLLAETGDRAGALARFEAIRARDPLAYDVSYRVGVMKAEEGAFEDALQAFDDALKLNPDDLAVLIDKGNALYALNRLDEALACFEKADRLHPGETFILNNLGVVSFAAGQADKAERAYRAALAHAPNDPEVLNNLGILLMLTDRLGEASATFAEALKAEEVSTEAFQNAGMVAVLQGDDETAIHFFRQGIEQDPDNAELHHNLGLSLLRLGRYEEGWRENEARQRTRLQAPHVPTFDVPTWSGEKGEGETILLYAEQGFGDTIQFCRFAPQVQKCGYRVLLFVPKPLTRLLKTLDGVEGVYDDPALLPPFQKVCALMSLPHRLGVTLETIPAVLPYLKADPASVQAWQEKCGTEGFKVGLVWSGAEHRASPDAAARERRRSVPFETLKVLQGIENVTFVRLQKETRDDLASFPMIDAVAGCADFADTAALVAALDLVITVDTSVAHLAGALGKQVWLLNRFDSCWRWLKDRTDSPWYPGVLRQFRQTKPGDWEDVLRRVREELIRAKR